MSEMNELSLEDKTSFFPFQKPALRVRYDAHRDRIIAGGLDGQLKFFQSDGESPDNL